MSTLTDAVRLVPYIENSNGYLKVYMELNGGFEVGDTVFITVRDTGSDEYNDLDSLGTITGDNIDNFFFSEKHGYEILSVVDNGVVVNKPFSDLNISTITTNNCFLSKISCNAINFDNGKLNGAVFRESNINTGGADTDVEWVQAVVMDLISSAVDNVIFTKKYADDTLTLNCELENGLPVHRYSYNNDGYGPSLLGIVPTPSNFVLDNCTFYDGWMSGCTIEGGNIINLTEIYGGNFLSCTVKKSRINDGKFVDCTLDIESTWNYGIWENGNASNAFNSLVWNDGIWNRGVFPGISTWKNGTFNDGYLYDGSRNRFNSYNWSNGVFNGGVFNGANWENGTFNGGEFNGSLWRNGTFNNDAVFNGAEWENGTFNNGTFNGVTWWNGTFNNGTFEDGIWKTGNFYGGNFLGTEWQQGNFYGGTITTAWLNGNFYDGTAIGMNWSIGNFYNGTFDSGLWTNGTWYYGTMINSDWENGTWYNGTADGTTFGAGTWKNGIFNNEVFDTTWEKGSFNSGIFTGDWLNGNFYGGTFNGSWSGGTFYCGEDQSGTIPSSDKAGRCFEPYKKEDIVRKLNTR